MLVAVGDWIRPPVNRTTPPVSITNVPGICMKLPPLSPRWRVSGESSARIHGRAVLGLRTCMTLPCINPYAR